MKWSFSLKRNDDERFSVEKGVARSLPPLRDDRSTSPEANDSTTKDLVPSAIDDTPEIKFSNTVSQTHERIPFLSFLFSSLRCV